MPRVPVNDWGAKRRGPKYYVNRAPPLGWHPPLASVSQLRETMSSKKLASLLERESKTYVSAGQVPYGYPASSFVQIKDHVQASDWETISDSSVSACSDSFNEGSVHEASSVQRTTKPKPHGMPYGQAWQFKPFPLSKGEERLIIKKRQWRKLDYTSYGDYSVAPGRYDLKWIQRIFWAAREVRSAVRTAVPFFSRHLVGDLLKIRNLIYSLSPGNGRRSELQSKLFSDVYFCLRQCKRLQGERGSSIRANPA